MRGDWVTTGENFPTAWPRGDTNLLVSEGVLDLWGGSLEGLEDAISKCANGNGTGPQAVVDYLCANAGELLDSDDVTAVALRHNG